MATVAKVNKQTVAMVTVAKVNKQTVANLPFTSMYPAWYRI